MDESGDHSPGTSCPSLVTVVIPAFNAAKYIGEAIQSVLDQTHTNLQILVIDDGSTDNTDEVAAGFGADVEYVHRENAGACAARNHGIRLAKGTYVAFLDADDAWLPDKLARQVDVLETHPDFGAVHGDSTRMNEKGEPLPGDPPGEKQSRDGDVFMEFFEANLSVILTSTVMVRRSCIDEIGVFDGGGEVVDDHDFFLRLAAHYPIGYIREPLLRYRVLPGSLSRLRAVQRVEQHEETLRRAIAANPERFDGLPPGYFEQRWQAFYRWAGMMLYYQGEYRAARPHLRKALRSSSQILFYYLLTYLRRARETQPRGHPSSPKGYAGTGGGTEGKM